MEYREILDSFAQLNALAKEEQFVYSLTSNSLQQALKGEKLNLPIDIAITFSSLLKLKFFHPEKLTLPSENSLENFFPILQIGTVSYRLFILTESTPEILSSKSISKIFDKLKLSKDIDIFLVLDQIFSEEPSIWSYLYKDTNDEIKLDKITRMNPNYYNVLKLDDVSVPYLEYFKNKQ
ncbi:hypothetical protein [Mycoplasmopsis verecunda]|uniref:Uncharacterized protein n=1 Tax=Mycoplasmopsis verecunda TaxID=171291 RepID=A0A1T4MB42_9BACT|nr:hypothetical protein [Mycoplasmopsis verecunda]WPB54553.1 hypothetical protein SAM46_00065 [Mycoplasmopsis verecunda]SJZ64239.1 hypothetical protein SAMN02745154_00669 [Mycoplasmopsis verecunda]